MVGLRQAPVRMSFDATAVAGARPTRGLRAKRLQAFARVPLRAGALTPAAHERNLLRSDELRDALTQVATSLGAAHEPVAFLLPDGVARVALLEAPAQVQPGEYARYRLTPGLPYPAREAVVQAESAGRGRILAAVVWRAVIAEYEEAVRAAGLTQDRMDLAPLAGLQALRRSASGSESGVDLVLGDAAYALAVHEGARWRVLRNRRRDRGGDEPRRLALEVERTFRLCGLDERTRVRVVGSGAPDLVRELRAAGRVAEPGWIVDGGGLPLEAAELPWLGSLFA